MAETRLRRRVLGRYWPLPLIFLVALMVASCGGDSGQVSRLSAPTLTPQGVAYDPGMIHIHDLGIDESDGALYVATHTGLYRVPAGGEPERVAGIMDLMGFTIYEPGVFLASGHPSPVMISEQKLPPHLGLLRSTDGGHNWESIALLGEADFHVLHPVPGGLYGYNASQGLLMFSEDLVTWESRGMVDLYALVADPQNNDFLIGATPQGLATSENGGTRWQMQRGAPQITVLAWGDLPKPVGITRSGEVVMMETGSEWETIFRFPAAPEALGLYKMTLLAAIRGNGIWQSEDGGRTWEQIVPAQPASYPR